MEDLTPASFGEMLKALRREKHLTQQALATRLGVHRNTIGIWERGDFLPETKGMVLELARVLHLSESQTRQLLEASLTGLPPVWYVPYPRNPFFTGREAILEALHERLAGPQAVALTQSYALHGLGGIGKTHLAVEYTYRYGFSYAAIFWIRAENGENILSSFAAIAELLRVPERGESDQQKMVAAVQRWLNTHSQWLLIWDNVEDLALLQRFLPTTRQGATLLTTRRQALGTLAEGIELPTMTPEEGISFLLRRARVLTQEAEQQQTKQLARQRPLEYQAAERLVAEMEGLPLALDQAGAYIEETPCSVADYLELFETRRKQLLGRRGGAISEHPFSVVATWSLSFEKVEQANPLASDLLRLCAFLHPDAIPEEVLIQANTSLDEEGGAADRLQLHEALRTVSAYSLLPHQAQERTFSIHRLVQAVLRDGMDEHLSQQWVERAVEILDAIFPEVEHVNWGQCERLVPHVLVCAHILREQNHLSLASLLHKAATYRCERGQYAETEPLLRRACQIRELALGVSHPDLATSLNGLADLYQAQGKYDEAEPLYQRALAIREQQLGETHPHVATSLHYLANLYSRQGKYAEAELLYQRALAIREQQLGETHPDVVIPLHNLAIIYNEQGKYEQAEPLYRRALLIFEQQLGLEHPRVGTVLNNLAIIYKEQGKYAEAEPLYLRALAIKEQQLGETHPHVAYPLNGLADLYQAQGKYDEAEPLYLRALAIREQQLGETHPHVAYPLNGLADLYQAQGKYDEAEPLYLRALAIREQQLGKTHPHVAHSLNGLADLYQAQGKYDEAEPLYLRALGICKQSLGLEHPRTQTVRNNYARLLRAME
jgi:tetratricopeptide (TPR) repeat protein/transcriptional regulator with XRE-family HTH domain